MRGYPKGPMAKQDYENLLSIPEHADDAKSDLIKLAAVDDNKVTVDQGTTDAPKLVEITNPLPAWKRAGFKDKAELSALAVADVTPEPIDDEIIEKP